MFGDKPVVRIGIGSIYIGGDKKATCNSVTIDLTADGDPDPGFVPDGSVCRTHAKETTVRSTR